MTTYKMTGNGIHYEVNPGPRGRVFIILRPFRQAHSLEDIRRAKIQLYADMDVAGIEVKYMTSRNLSPLNY